MLFGKLAIMDEHLEEITLLLSLENRELHALHKKRDFAFEP